MTMFILAQAAIGAELGPWVLGAGALIAVINGLVKLGDRLWLEPKRQSKLNDAMVCRSQPCAIDSRLLESNFRDLRQAMQGMIEQSRALASAATTQLEISRTRHEEVMRAVSSVRSGHRQS